METEKHALVEELKKKYEEDVQKAVEETKKKQWVRQHKREGPAKVKWCNLKS